MPKSGKPDFGCKRGRGRESGRVAGARAAMISDTLDDALAPVTDGIVLAVPREVAGVPMEATRALIRRGVRRLHLVALPTSSLQADLLIGAGAGAALGAPAGGPRDVGPGRALSRGSPHR